MFYRYSCALSVLVSICHIFSCWQYGHLCPFASESMIKWSVTVTDFTSILKSRKATLAIFKWQPQRRAASKGAAAAGRTGRSGGPQIVGH